MLKMLSLIELSLKQQQIVGLRFLQTNASDQKAPRETLKPSSLFIRPVKRAVSSQAKRVLVDCAILSVGGRRRKMSVGEASHY